LGLLTDRIKDEKKKSNILIAVQIIIIIFLTALPVLYNVEFISGKKACEAIYEASKPNMTLDDVIYGKNSTIDYCEGKGCV